MIESRGEDLVGADHYVEEAATSYFLARVRREIESYWFLYLSRRGYGLLLFSTLTATLISALVLVATIWRVVEYHGPVIYGYVSPINYNLMVNGNQVVYRHLDSVVIASRFFLLFAIVILVYSLIGLLTITRAYRASRLETIAQASIKPLRRQWASFALLSPIGAGLIVLLLFSILRVLAYDIIPHLPRTIFMAPTAARVYIYDPDVTYTWVIRYLAWRPIVFIILFAIAGFATLLSILYILYNPRLPVVKITRPRRVIAELKSR